MKIIFLGTGTSQGVPIVGCDCTVCLSTNPLDKRLRSSVYIEVNGLRLTIDSGPDFRQQLLTNNIGDLDAIIYTHEHKDHIAGLDDIRPINFLRKKDVDLYAEGRVLETIKTEFHYAFSDMKYPGLPQLNTFEITEDQFSIGDLVVTPIRVNHHKLPVLGFRINEFVYITDASSISDAELEKCMNCRVMVINSLREEEHFSHFNLEQAIGILQRVNPERGYLTHISHMMPNHKTIAAQLPRGIMPAFDGLQLHI